MKFWYGVGATLVVLLAVIAIFNLFDDRREVKAVPRVDYSTFLAELEKGGVTSVQIGDGTITGTFSDKHIFTTYAPEDPGLVSRLAEKGVNFSAEPEDAMHPLFSILVSWGPVLFLVWGVFAISRQLRAMRFRETHTQLQALAGVLDGLKGVLERHAAALEQASHPLIPSAAEPSAPPPALDR